MRSSLAETTAPAFSTHNNAVMFHSRLGFFLTTQQLWLLDVIGCWKCISVDFQNEVDDSLCRKPSFQEDNFCCYLGHCFGWCGCPYCGGFGPKFVASKTGCRAFFTIQFSPFALGNFAKTHSSHLSSNRQVLDIWVCLKMGYTPQMLICIRKMMINHQVNQVWGYFIFRQTYFGISSQVAISRFSHGPEVHLHLFGLSKVSSVCIE